MPEINEEFEPLFDYSRVQPLNFVCLDDDDDDDDEGEDATPDFSSKRRKLSDHIVVENLEEDEKVIQTVDSGEKEEEEDWLLPPPKVSSDAQKILGEDSTIKELRLKRQELVSFAQSAEEVLRAVEETAKRELQYSLEPVPDQPSQPPCERSKIVISVQDKDGLKQFRMYMDDKFERLFKMYADKVKLDLQSLVFCFDGDKISPVATPKGLGMEEDDIIEVHAKSS